MHYPSHPEKDKYHVTSLPGRTQRTKAKDKQNRNRLKNTENKLVGTRGEGVGLLGEKWKGNKKYPLIVTK